MKCEQKWIENRNQNGYQNFRKKEGGEEEFFLGFIVFSFWKRSKCEQFSLQKGVLLREERIFFFK